jgi:hypothetical protein
VANQDSITPSLAGQVWLKSVQHPFLNRPVHVQTWGGVGRPGRSSVFDTVGNSAPVSRGDVRGSRGWSMTIITGDIFDSEVEALEQARDFDLILATGDIFFVHVPPDRGVPGGYVDILNETNEDRYPRKGEDGTRTFELSCKVMRQPAPEIIGGTMTYDALLNLYGGYNNAAAANATNNALLNLMATPEDLVVL